MALLAGNAVAVAVQAGAVAGLASVEGAGRPVSVAYRHGGCGLPGDCYQEHDARSIWPHRRSDRLRGQLCQLRRAVWTDGV